MTSKRSSKFAMPKYPINHERYKHKLRTTLHINPTRLYTLRQKHAHQKRQKKVKNYINSSQSLSFCHSNYLCIPKAFVFVCLFFKFYLTFTSGSLFLRPLSLQYITYTLTYTLHIHRQKEKTKKSERQRERNWKWGLWRNKRRFLTRKQRRRW